MNNENKLNELNTANERILAEGRTVSNDSFRTGLNNNDLIIGPSGGGKTTGYVIPNINQHYGSYIVADTKGNLCRKLERSLRQAGYRVNTLDLVDLERSCRYNPLDFITRNGKSYSELDVTRLAAILSPVQIKTDPFWELTAQTVLAALIAFTLETMPRQEQDLITVNKLSKLMNSPNFGKLFTKLEIQNPDSFAVKKFQSFKEVIHVDKTWGCIEQFVSKALSIFDLKAFKKMFRGNQRKVNFESIASEPNVLFINISDTERSLDPMTNIFYSQMFQQLCQIADKSPDSRLKVPVQVILDDFATNAYIPHFDKLISVVRSRNISACPVIQSLSQLETLYGVSASKTIINNCDHILYLGGSDVETADFISSHTDKSRETVMYMPLDKAYLIERGKKGELVDKIRPFASETRAESLPREDSIPESQDICSCPAS